MNKNSFGMEFNFALADNSDNFEVGYTYKDSDGRTVTGQYDGNNLDDLVAQLYQDCIKALMPEPEPELTEEEKLRLEIENLKAENERLEHRLQELMKPVEDTMENPKVAARKKYADTYNLDYDKFWDTFDEVMALFK
jgi:hypothetical protein